MTYFANGTDGEIYMEEYCYRCANWKDQGDGSGEGCPVMDLHFLHNGEEQWRGVLDDFIPPVGAPAWHGECRCFAPVNMKPDRFYRPAPPKAYQLLSQALHDLESMEEATQEVAEAQLEEVARHYDPDHKCDESCESAPMAVWLQNLWSEGTIKDIRAFLATNGTSVGTDGGPR